jgi:hypothetical protein
MILNIVEKYSKIIQSYDIQKFKIVDLSYHLACTIEIKNQTKLFIKDYLFLDGSRKYSFHWQDANGNCIIRWDNAPHHQDVTTFPYHKHIGKEENVEESQPVKLETVMEYISKQIN